MAKQTCKDCGGRGWPETGRFHMGLPQIKKCPTCKGTGYKDRTGPYRLANGDWSDGVDRSKRIRFRYITSRYEITVASEGSAFVWQESILFGTKRPTHAEAIAYADRMARTNQGDNK